MLQSTTTTQFTVKVNSPFPSTKKGRFSSKKVSNAVRLSSEGSASTCPKSGFTVALSTRFEAGRYLRSPPAVTLFSRVSPPAPRSGTLLVTTYGVTSACPGEAQAGEAGELAELGRQAAVGDPVQRPGDGRGVALDHPPDQETEGPAGLGGVVELGERDTVLRGPPQRVDPGGDVPHRVPVHVLVAVVIDGVVGLDPGGIDRKLEAGAAVVIGIEHDRHVVRGGLVVPPAEQAHDAVGMGIEGADEDVEIVLVEGDPGLGAALGLRALARLRLVGTGSPAGRWPRRGRRCCRRGPAVRRCGSRGPSRRPGAAGFPAPGPAPAAAYRAAVSPRAPAREGCEG